MRGDQDGHDCPPSHEGTLRARAWQEHQALEWETTFFYIADTLKASGLFKWLAINTDSEEIGRNAFERYGDWVRVIERSPELRGDHVPMNSIIAHDVILLGRENDYFQTHSTNPLLSCETIRAAVEQYLEGKMSRKFDSVFSVNALHTRLYDKNLRPLNHNPAVLIRTQDLDIIYEENSNFYVFSGESFAATTTGSALHPVLM